MYSSAAAELSSMALDIDSDHHGGRLVGLGMGMVLVGMEAAAASVRVFVAFQIRLSRAA